MNAPSVLTHMQSLSSAVHYSTLYSKPITVIHHVRHLDIYQFDIYQSDIYTIYSAQYCTTPHDSTTQHTPQHHLPCPHPHPQPPPLPPYLNVLRLPHSLHHVWPPPRLPTPDRPALALLLRPIPHVFAPLSSHRVAIPCPSAPNLPSSRTSRHPTSIF